MQFPIIVQGIPQLGFLLSPGVWEWPEILEESFPIAPWGNLGICCHGESFTTPIGSLHFPREKRCNQKIFLMRNVPLGFLYLNVWSLVDGAVVRGNMSLGGQGWTLGIYSVTWFLLSLPVSCMWIKCDQPASDSCGHAFHSCCYFLSPWQSLCPLEL